MGGGEEDTGEGEDRVEIDRHNARQGERSTFSIVRTEKPYASESRMIRSLNGLRETPR
jgi:hypothetical protein